MSFSFLLSHCCFFRVDVLGLLLELTLLLFAKTSHSIYPTHNILHIPCIMYVWIYENGAEELDPKP